MIAELLESPSNRAMLVAATCNASCALVGCYLVLRRMSLMGDAISHAVLPGLVIAFLISLSIGGALDGLNLPGPVLAFLEFVTTGEMPLLLGALGAGIATTFLTQVIQRYARVAPDASLGVVYTSLFALGVLLVKRYVSEIHFDVACVYEGSLLQVALDTVDIMGVQVPRAMFGAAPVLLIVLACITLFWKELKLSSFDATLAATFGLAPGAMHYLLMLLVSLAAVTSFEAIGSILVVAMLIAPAAAAQLLVNRLGPMLLISVALAVTATVGGYQAAVWLNVSPAGAISVVAGLLYLAAAVLSPTQGVLSRVLNNARVALRVRSEDVLALLYRNHESGVASVTRQEAVETAGGALLGNLAVRHLVRRGEVEADDLGLKLTESGAAAGAALVRSHRLWESYLVDEVGIQADHVHEAAHVMEHVIDDKIREEIANQLGGVETDPHGREIP